MSDDPTPIDTASVDSGGEEVVTENPVNELLADFRTWLIESQPELAAPVPATLDVATVVQQFIALRQEVNLQTKATRTQQEQAGQSLSLLQQAMEALKRQDAQLQESAKGSVDEAVRPLLKTLVDAHDALSLAERGLERIERQPLPEPPPSAPPPPPTVTAVSLELPPPPPLKIWVPYWARWLGLGELIERQLEPMRRWHAGLKSRGVSIPTTPEPEPSPVDDIIDERAERLKQSIDALLVGYRMSLQRLERAMTQFGLEAIDCVGEPFDPETMEVAEVVREEGREGTEVLDIVRPGYRWQGRLFRYAHVRVVKG